MFSKCKVTVVRRDFNDDLVEQYMNTPNTNSKCNRVSDGQEFIIDNPFEMPEGLCPYAWADIRPMIMAIATGGTFEMMKDRDSTLAVCSDLFRPVIFKIERVTE